MGSESADDAFASLFARMARPLRETGQRGKAGREDRENWGHPALPRPLSFAQPLAKQESRDHPTEEKTATKCDKPNKVTSGGPVPAQPEEPHQPCPTPARRHESKSQKPSLSVPQREGPVCRVQQKLGGEQPRTQSAPLRCPRWWCGWGAGHQGWTPAPRSPGHWALEAQGPRPFQVGVAGGARPVVRLQVVRRAKARRAQGSRARGPH